MIQFAKGRPKDIVCAAMVACLLAWMVIYIAKLRATSRFGLRLGRTVRPAPAPSPSAVVQIPSIDACTALEWSLSDVYVHHDERCKQPTSQHPITVVTAFYYSNTSKHTASEYMKWIKLFLLRIQTPTVVYTNCKTSHAAPQFVKILGERKTKLPLRTHVRFLDLESTDLARQFGPIMARHEKRDPELHVGHNYLLYIIWLNKVENLMDAVRRNVFCSQWFVWSDIGAFRSESHSYKDWPSLQRLRTVPTNRVLMGLISQFSSGDESTWGDGPSNCTTWLHQNSTALIDSDHIGGGFIAFSTEQGVQYDFYYALRDTYKHLSAVDHLIVKEQTVFNAMVLLHRELFALIPNQKAPLNIWFYTIHWLAKSSERDGDGYGKLFDLLLPKKLNTPKCTIP